MPRFKMKRKKKGLWIGAKLLFFAVFVCAIAIICSDRAVDMIREVAQSELDSLAYDIINEAVEKELTSDGINYDDLVSIEKDANGKVSAIRTNMYMMNLLKLNIARDISDEMFRRIEQEIAIPLGNLTGLDFLTGRGPKIKFKAMWVTGVDATYRNSFSDAGINQTRHQIMMDFVVDVGMMFAGRTIGGDVISSICIAETIIVGETPKYFSEN